MYCIKCGQQLPDEAQFCCNCGTKTARPTPTDEVSAKASDFVVSDDINISSGDLNSDLVAKEASLFGDFPSEPQSQIAFVPPLPPMPKRTTPEYKFSRSQCNDDPDLWIVRRDDDLLGLHECRLENKQSDLVSDWFDDIYYQKGDELMEEENIEEILDTNYNILILDPQVFDYEEGFIIYKNENEQNDTIYIFDDSDFYLNQTEK